MSFKHTYVYKSNKITVITVEILKIRTAEKFALMTLKFEERMTRSIYLLQLA